MNPRKVLIIVGGLVLVAIIFMLLRSFGSKDVTRPNLDQVIANNTIIVGISNEAAQNASLYPVQTAAATVYATTSSDNAQLLAYYKERFGKESKAGKDSAAQDATKELKNTPPGNSFDNTYKQKAEELLQSNLDTLKSTFEQTKSQKLKDLLSKIYDNQEAALKSLQALP